MQIATMARTRAPSAAVATLSVDEREHDLPGLAIPRAEIHLVVRFGSVARDGLDVYAMGSRQTVYRKLLVGGQQTITARLRLGAHETVLGASASALAGRVVALEDLWGAAAAERLRDRLASATSAAAAAPILEAAIVDRVAGGDPGRARARIVQDAASRLVSANVNAVAGELGMSERHLRRLFLETVGVGPKTFARLARFRRAVSAARAGELGWASIAIAAGYYDQAHLIAEFREIAGVTPQALRTELRSSLAMG